MRDYYITWLIANALALIAGVSIIGLGCYLLRRVVEDMSNSTDQSAYRLRYFRVAPGAALVGFGAILAATIIVRMLCLPLPTAN